MSDRRRRPSAGTIIAIWALVVALSGTAAASVAQTHRATTRLRWQKLTLVSGWVAYGGGTTAPAVAVDSMGFIHFKGAMSGGTDTGFSTLPRAYRPSRLVMAPVTLRDGNPGIMMISPSGIAWVADANGGVANAAQMTSLEGVSFPK